jgi:hemerythrin-like domain-containing protein
MQVINLLREEHKKLKVFHLYLNTAADKLIKGEKISPVIFQKVAKFAEFFIRNYHMWIEDDLIIKFLKSKGFPDREGVLEELENDHREAEKYLSDLLAAIMIMGENTDSILNKNFETNIQAYSQLIAAHVGEEETILFPLLKSVLSSEEDQELYSKVKESIQGLNQDLLQLYQKSLDEIKAELGVKSLNEQEELEKLWLLMQINPMEIIKDE